jgi:hypothetical protein
MIFYRVQSIVDGRGPWRPGFSKKWLDNSRTDEEYRRLPLWTKEFDRWKILREAGHEYVGCGCVSPEQLRLWFTPLEYSRLIALGFLAVQFTDARLLAQSDVQCVFSRKKPLYDDVKPFDFNP